MNRAGPQRVGKCIANLQAKANKEERLRQADRADPRSGRVAAETTSRVVTRIQDEVWDKDHDKQCNDGLATRQSETFSRRCRLVLWR